MIIDDIDLAAVNDERIEACFAGPLADRSFGRYGKPGSTATRPYQRAAVLITLLPKRSGLHVLLTKRAAHLQYHPGQISFPGGRHDKADVDMVATALRETEEEVGIFARSIRILDQFGLYCTPTGYAITPVVGLLTENVVLSVSADEVDSVFDIPLSFVQNERNREPVEIRRNDYLYRGYAYHYLDHRIWGATAAILKKLADTLRGYGH